MCGRFAQISPKQRYAQAIGLPEADDPRACQGDQIPSYDIRPAQCPWVVRTERWGEPGFIAASWGLLPGWANQRGAPRPINARIETAAANGYFREAFRRRRCLVPMDAFYEWRQVEGARGKQRYCIRRADKEPMIAAGLWEEWMGGEGTFPTFTILTTEACDFLRPIHGRQPVILAPEVYLAWVDPKITAPEEVAALGREAPAQDLAAYPVNSDPGASGPELMRPETPGR